MNGINNNVEYEEKDTERKGISFSVLIILTLVVAIAGSTYAFFSVSVTDSSITGSSAYNARSFELTVTHLTSAASGKLIPQLDSAINTAVNTTNNCKDARGNTVCQLYQVTVKNVSEVTYYISGTFTLNAETMDNIKWAVASSRTGFDTAAKNAKTVTTLVNITSATQLAPQGSQTYYIVVWISETGASQTDSGTFTGTITFNGHSSTTGDAASGITSTIRS